MSETNPPSDPQEAPEALAAATAEIERLSKEYADFRRNVLAVGQEEAAKHDWCNEWKRIAVDRMGFSPDEFPPSHADVTVMIGETPIVVRMRLNAQGSVNPRAVVSQLCADLGYSDAGRALSASRDWYTVTPVRVTY